MASQRFEPWRQAVQHLLTKIDTPTLHQLLLVLTKQRSEMVKAHSNGETGTLRRRGQFATAQEATPVAAVGDALPGHASGV